MPTIKPRITVTLSDRQHAVLRSLSKNSGQSMSAYIAEVMELVLPTLERMAATMQALAQSRDADMQRVRDQLDEAQRVFEPLAMAAVAQADMFMERIERAVGAGGAAAPHGPTAGTSPPPTNRGVTPTPPKPLKPKPRAASRGVRARSLKSEKGASK
jgi:predicted DNA-binding protein